MGAGPDPELASAAGLVPLARGVAYTASKHAAVGFHEALRQELRQSCPAVQSTLVTPFFVNTGMFAGASTRFPWLLPMVEPAASVFVVPGGGSVRSATTSIRQVPVSRC